jgi:CBS domain-containing protein
MKTPVSQILQSKGRNVWSTTPRSSVYDALQLMAEKDIGALLVIDEGKILGIFSERDYARKIALEGRSSRETPVEDIMTRSVCYVPPWRTLDECMALMTAKRVRHLPVLDEGRLVGILSIGDIVKAIISEQEYLLHELEAFVDEALKDQKSGE